MKKVFFSMTLVLMSTFAFANCYTDMLNAFNENNENFRGALAGAAAEAGFECIGAIEGLGSNPTPFGAALAIGLLLNTACDSIGDVDGIANLYDSIYEQIGTDYCNCVGGTNC